MLQKAEEDKREEWTSQQCTADTAEGKGALSTAAMTAISDIQTPVTSALGREEYLLSTGFFPLHPLTRSSVVRRKELHHTEINERSPAGWWDRHEEPWLPHINIRSNQTDRQKQGLEVGPGDRACHVCEGEKLGPFRLSIIACRLLFLSELCINTWSGLEDTE